MRLVALFLAIFIPGAGQFYNGQYIKGLFFLLYECALNTLAGINKAIYLDSIGHHKEALQHVNYQWAEYYPGFLIYTAWDAFFYAKPGGNKMSAIPFIIATIIGYFAVTYANYIPWPLLSGGVAIIVPMIVGGIIYNKSVPIDPRDPRDPS